MLLAKKSLVESEISSLRTMMAFSNSTTSQTTKTLEELQKYVTAASAEQKNKTEEAMKARHKCMESNSAQSTSTKPDKPLVTDIPKTGPNSGSVDDAIIEANKPTVDRKKDELKGEKGPGTGSKGEKGTGTGSKGGPDTGSTDTVDRKKDKLKGEKGTGTGSKGEKGTGTGSKGGPDTGSTDTKKSSGGKAPISDACKKLRGAMESAVDSTFNQAQANSQYQTAAFALNSDNKYNSFLNARVTSLQQRLTAIENDLENAKPYMGPIADSRDFQDLQKTLKATEQSLDDEWLQFEYDSDSSHVKTSQDTTSVNAALGLSYNNPVPEGLSLSGNVNVGYSDTDLEHSLSSADVQVSGELLRVTVKRPWFKPSIFDDTSLSYVSYNRYDYVHGSTKKNNNKGSNKVIVILKCFSF